MGFTTPCFIRKDTEYLREKLKELGYTPLDDDKRDGLVADRSGYMYSILENNLISSTYNCGVNENLFLAIAALRDDTDKFQWFTDSYHWEICPDEVAYINAWIDKYESSPHKATVEELIEHFKEKEVSHG